LLGNVEIPSDIGGVIYIDYNKAGGWHLRLATEIQAAGIVVDLNRAAYKQ
jgi:predicted nucleotide-binding protein